MSAVRHRGPTGQGRNTVKRPAPAAVEPKVNRYTEVEFDELLFANNAFQWVMIEYWFEEGVHVVVDDAGEVIPWPEVKRRAAVRNKDRAIDEAVREAKKRAHLDPDVPALPEAFIEHMAEEARRPFWERQVDRVLVAKVDEANRPAESSCCMGLPGQGSCPRCGPRGVQS